MPSPNVSIPEVVATTLINRSGELADNVTKNNGLLFRLSQKGNVKTADGGQYIMQELEYAENSTFIRYSGYEPLNINPSDVFTGASYDWKQAATAVTMSGLEQMQNSGREAIIDWLEARIKNAYRTMRNNVAADIYSTGTLDGGKQIGGLQLLVADVPNTGIVGGINRASWPFWQNQIFRSSTDGLVASINAGNIQLLMNKLYVKLCRGTDHPDLIIMDSNNYALYLASNQAIQRITQPDMASLGFTTLKYLASDVILDGGYGGAAPADHIYMLNTDYIFFRPHKDRNFVPLEQVNSLNQDAFVKLMVFGGNMTMSNAFLQGVLYKD